jgi:uncharacterized RDD family membrane protein YckC
VTSSPDAAGASGAWGATAPGIVTPEAVVLDLPVAGIGSRAVAAMLDLTIQFGSLLLFAFVAGAVNTGRFGWVGTVVVLLFVFSILFVYPVAFETGLRGRTPGKMAVGLRVVTIEGSPVQFRHAAVRAALAVVDIHLTFGGIATLSAFLSARGQRLGDIAAGTIVIRERAGRDGNRALRFEPPPGAEGLMARLDVGAMTEDDYVAVRSLLVRAATLTPSQTEHLARQVIGAIRARVRPEPPPGMPAAAYLQCIAAGYQRRMAGRPDKDVTAWLWAQEPAGS